MAIQRMEHVGIVVDDLPAAVEFFVQLGLELQGEALVEGRWVAALWGLKVCGQISRCFRPRMATTT